MKSLIKQLLKEQVDHKMLNFLINKFGKELLLKASATKLIKLEKGNTQIKGGIEKKLYDLGLSSNELMEIKHHLYWNVDFYNKKIDEYVKMYGDNPKVAKERFLKDVISELSGAATRGFRTDLYNKFLNKLSEYSGIEISRGHSRPEKSNILLKLSKFIEDPTDTPKSRSEFLKNLGVPRSHYSTTFTKLLRNGLIKTIKKDGKKVYELGPNFDKFINGEPSFTGDMEELFDDYISEYGFSLNNFYNHFRPLFYYDSDYIKFVKSFREYVDSEDHLRLSLLMNRNKNK